jgi:hypothetical protein
MQNNMHDLDNLAIWERNGGYQCKQYFSQKVTVKAKIFKNFSQSDDIMSPGSHVGWLIGTKVTPLGQAMQRNIPAKFGHICFSDSLKED